MDRDLIKQQLEHALEGTNFDDQGELYKGKVRDNYINEDTITMVTTDRISAFDHVLPKGIPYKGQVLNQIAAKFLKDTEDIVQNWMIDTPDPSVTVGKKCNPFKVEMVIRGYLTGHAWREYKSGKRLLCGVPMQDGMKENQKFTNPIITPTTKAEVGHDEDISREEILSSGLVNENDYIENGFQGKNGQSIPYMSDEYCNSVAERYIELFEKITGDNFKKENVNDVYNRVESNILNYLEKIV